MQVCLKWLFYVNHYSINFSFDNIEFIEKIFGKSILLIERDEVENFIQLNIARKNTLLNLSRQNWEDDLIGKIMIVREDQ